jgi:DNA-cytosine methyltransferase
MDVNLSLFDGISCSQVALKQAGMHHYMHLASEIDKTPIKITMHNHPKRTVQLGDVRNIKGSNLPEINILFAGSPCQGFSFSGGQLNFEHPQSKLFFEFVRILKETLPRYFLLENVRMKQSYMDVISSHLGIQPVCINANAFIPQSRNRLYWVGKRVGDSYVQVPINPIIHKDVTINDVLEYPVPNRDTLTDDVITSEVKKLLKNSKYENTFKWRWDSQGRILVTRGDDLKIQRIGRIAFADNKYAEIVTCLTQPHVAFRKLSVIECTRLMGLPSNYVNDVGISKSGSYKALGNAWVVDVITHILKSIGLESMR